MVVFTLTTIANQPLKVLPKNPKRAVWSALNYSDSDVYYGHDQSVTTTGRTKGWRIPAAGGSVEDEYHRGEVWLICEYDGKEVTIEEVTVEE
jgi:hypothetical protein